MEFRLHFVDINRTNLSALAKEFADVKGVTYKQSDIGQSFSGCEMPRCVADAGQSFAMMDGGIDGAINRLLSTPYKDIQTDTQKAIAQRYDGEQPVGTCIIVPAHAGVEFLAYAPTMRIPQDSANTLNAYLAFRAVLVEVRRHRPTIKTLICSSLCTGAGEMNPAVAAAQMKLAWQSVFVEEARPKYHWRHIREFHRKLQATLQLNQS